MKVIYKYPLRFLDRDNIQELELPAGAELLKVDVQNGVVTLWALVDTENRMRLEKFALRMTGEELDYSFDAEWEHLETVQMYPYVYHIFRRK